MKLPFSRTIQQAIKNKQQKQQINRYIINNHWYFKTDIFTMFNSEFEDYKKFYNIDVKNKTVLDVGAECGSTAMYFFIRGAKKVICIEPNTKYLFYLRKNKEYHNIEVIPEYFNLNHLDYLKFDVVKLDIEGYEEILLNYNKKIDYPIMLEIHGLQLIEKFADKGYKIKFKDSDIEHSRQCLAYGYLNANL